MHDFLLLLCSNNISIFNLNTKFEVPSFISSVDVMGPRFKIGHVFLATPSLRMLVIINLCAIDDSSFAQCKDMKEKPKRKIG